MKSVIQKHKKVCQTFVPADFFDEKTTLHRRVVLLYKRGREALSAG